MNECDGAHYADVCRTLTGPTLSGPRAPTVLHFLGAERSCNDEWCELAPVLNDLQVCEGRPSTLTILNVGTWICGVNVHQMSSFRFPGGVGGEVYDILAPLCHNPTGTRTGEVKGLDVAPAWPCALSDDEERRPRDHYQGSEAPDPERAHTMTAAKDPKSRSEQTLAPEPARVVRIHADGHRKKSFSLPGMTLQY